MLLTPLTVYEKNYGDKFITNIALNVCLNGEYRYARHAIYCNLCAQSFSKLFVIT